ncbi:Purple acid phosphatase 3 [Spatholobus suberectus]|nr:Purple acid phosphatase 3 [Spatholobus suberectus]
MVMVELTKLQPDRQRKQWTDNDREMEEPVVTDEGLKISIQFLTSGGGSKAWRGDMKWKKREEMKFYYDGQGFMSVHISQIQLQIGFQQCYARMEHRQV